jgi:hypothetical protein
VRIVRLAGRLKLLVWATIAVAALLYVAARLELVFGNLHIVTRSAVELPGLWIARDLSAALLLLALWQLASMLALIERGDRFSPAVTRRFRRFALLLFAAAAVTLVAPPLAMLLAPPAPPHGPIQVPLSFRDLWTMLVTGVLFLVARLLDEAQRIEADLDEIV